MATTQRPAHPGSGMGKDILSRMLQMERQSKHQRASSASPTLAVAPEVDHYSASPARASKSPKRSPKLPLGTSQQFLHPSNMTRSQTSPLLATSAQSLEQSKPIEKPMPLRISTDIKSDDRPSEICISPSWSDHGEKARRKEKRKAEKDQKEWDKKSKQDEERQKALDAKAGKRLSKRPPPAAMETQKMPTSLRRNSWISFMSTQSSSGETTRRSSRDEKRMSGLSVGSEGSQRSQSTPGTSTDLVPATAGASERRHPIVSPSAPKLPSFRWSNSRKTSSDHIKPLSSGSDDAYEKDLIAFAYRLEASAVATENQEIDRPKAKQTPAVNNPPRVSLDRAALSKGIADPSLEGLPYQSVPSKGTPGPLKARSGDTEGAIAGVHGAHPSGKLSLPSSAKDTLFSSQNLSKPQERPSPDGSSYVHKQRMYQQQQSIAGFEDQQAVKDATDAANELAAEYEASINESSKFGSDRGRPPAPNASVEAVQRPKPKRDCSQDAGIATVYTKQRNRSTSPRREASPDKHPPAVSTLPLQNATETAQNQVASPITKGNGSPESFQQSPRKPQPSAGLRSDKILGFRRRTKQAPALVSVPYEVEHKVIGVKPSAPDALSVQEQAAKRSKIERFFKEPKPAFADKDRRLSSSSSRNPIQEVLPETKLEAKHTQNHNRTRTSSSTVLNNHVVSPISRSSTEPVLNKAITNPSADKHRESGSNTEDGSQAKQEIKPSSSRQEQSSAVTTSSVQSKPPSTSEPPTKVATPAQSTSDRKSDLHPAKKQPHEIIVESETGDGLVRRTSITRPRSNPLLHTQTAANSTAVDFLPPLKHQPLIKRERQSPTRADSSDAGPVSISQFQEPIAPLTYESPIPPDLKLMPRSPLRTPSQFPVPSGNRFNRSSTDVGTVSFSKGTLNEGVDAKPVAKLFVICCKCKFWHDLPSKLYEAMALPLELHNAEKGKVAGARLETAVKCPWCEHAMTTRCCQGWTTVVYMHERHH